MGIVHETSFESPENLRIRLVAMPENMNYRGDAFGGWLLAQMDLAAGTCGAERARGHVATVAVKDVSFTKPIFAGDVVDIHAVVSKVGRTSMTIDVSVMTTRRGESERLKTHEGCFVVVAIDEHRRPRLVDA